MTSSREEAGPPTSRASRSTAVAGAVRDELAKLRGRNLGACAACGRTVYFEHNFTRCSGRVVHVRCPITTPIRGIGGGDTQRSPVAPDA